MQTVLFFACSFLFFSIYGFVRARRSQAEDLRIDSLGLDATSTTIADAPAEGRIQITGRVSSLTSGEPLTAPFTGEEVVWARAEMQTNVGDVIDGWTILADEVGVADDSGQVAHVKLDRSTMRFSQTSVPADSQARYVEAFLDKQGFKRSAKQAAWPYQALLRPGDTVSVIATAHRSEPGYREDGGATLTLSAEDGELVLFNPDEQAKKPELDRTYVGCATFGIVVSALAVIVSLIVIYR